MKKYTLLFIVLCTSSAILAQKGHKIELTIPSLADSTVLLGYYYGESTYVKDTAQFNSEGLINFKGEEVLNQGIYFLVLNKQRLFDFPIGNDQHFSLSTSGPDYTINMNVTGDTDNQLFFDDLKYNASQNQLAAPYVKVMRDSTITESDKSSARKALTDLNEKVIAHQNTVIKEKPNSIIAKILKANKRVEIPESPVNEDKQTFSYNYYKTHYWDYFDLSDPVYIKMPTPVYKEKVNRYLDRLVVQYPDSLIKEIDLLVAQAKATEETYKYAVWLAVIKYQFPDIMGLDEVYVHLYDKYFASGEMDFWANEQLKSNLEERAEQLRNSLIGMPAPNLIMQDANLQEKSLYDIDKDYTVIYFYDPDCGHCKKETPKVVSFYNKTDFNVEVFAVSADTSMSKMKDYISEMQMNFINVNGPRTITKPYQQMYDASTTPTIYVLDREKRIIAKKLPAERLEEFLKQYEAIEKKENP